ncbi:MAG TPA: hypothetical protein VH496_11445 [Mycobacterium sp.]
MLTHSNSGANHDELTVDGVDFTPDKLVHLEVRPTNPGAFDPYVTDRDASASGAIHVKCGLQTVSPRDPGARSGYVVATDVTTQATTAPLPVTIFPPVMIDNG